jgi:hypothetical protein
MFHKKKERKKSFLSSLGRLPLPTAQRPPRVRTAAHPMPLPLAAQAAPRPSLAAQLHLPPAPALSHRQAGPTRQGEVIPNLPPDPHASSAATLVSALRASLRSPMLINRTSQRRRTPPTTLSSFPRRETLRTKRRRHCRRLEASAAVESPFPLRLRQRKPPPELRDKVRNPPDPSPSSLSCSLVRTTSTEDRRRC